ncbi:MAG: hypothetical protein V3U76_07650 [Granulosicoccus sp.]
MRIKNSALKKSVQMLILPLTMVGTGGNFLAAEQTLECQLYINSSTEDASSVSVPKAGVTLDSTRIGSFCLFADGSVADKQFVVISRAEDEGASGSGMGFSIYSFQNGDTLSLKFETTWGSNGLKGIYQVLDGTGSYAGASGDGTITGVESPWETSAIVDIVINVSTP